MSEPAVPTLVEHPAQPYVGIRDYVTMTSFGVVADRFPEIFAWLARRGIEPAGPPFFRYRVIDMDRALDVEAGVPVAEPVAPTEPVFADTLPAGRYASVSHLGHPDELLEVTARLLAWGEQQGIAFDRRDSPAGDAWTSRLEFFLTNPAEEPDLSSWRTELAFKVADG